MQMAMHDIPIDALFLLTLVFCAAVENMAPIAWVARGCGPTRSPPAR